MAVFIWYLQGTSPTTIEATDIVQFAGAGGFDSKVTVAAYNDTTHVESSVGANDSSANTPHNNKWLTSSTVSLNGAGSTALSAATTAQCALKVNFSDASSVITESAIFYAYDGTTTTAVPTGVTFVAAEQGDAAWTGAEGSAAAVTVTDDTTATSHDYYFLASVSPDSVGAKTAFKLRFELTYS